ncbi:hypothetical protein B0H19DRAFT_1152788 [Mycena capillaripes]|nr:hypothetical protein B0H19DRAFT_1152788 [Mycena capillaripes]
MSTWILDPVAGSTCSPCVFWFPTRPHLCPCAPAAGTRPFAPQIPLPTPTVCRPQFYTP